MGQYLSVDGRPLTTHTGIGQEITKLFKTYVRTAASSVETSTKITDPFCCLQLKCPRAAYDVNIEPGKDDVLFGDRDLVISLVEKLLSEHYGALEHSHKSSPAKAKTLSHNNPSGSSEFQLLLARRRPEQPPLQVQKDGHGSPNTTLSSPASERTTPPSSSQSPRSPRGAATEKNAGNDNTASESRGSRHLNPWSISRINASFHTPEKPRATLSNSHSPEETSPRVARQQNRQLRSARQSSQGSPELPSPPNSSVARCSPMSTQQTPRGALSEPRNSANSRRAARERDRALYGNGALDTWFQRITGGGPSQSPPASTPAQDENTPSLSQLARERFLRDQPRSRVAGASTDLEVPETPSNSYSPGDGDAQPSPQGGPDTASGYSGGPEGSMDSGRGFPVLERWAASPHKDLDSGSPTDLERALDFERRKKEANQRHRTHSGARDGQSNPATDLSPTPHHNRYLAAKASLTAEKPQNETSPGPALSPHDPRAYLMRHQNDHQSNKSSSTVGTVQRLHTSKLPFERIPDGHNLHDSCLPLPADLSLISSTFQLTTLHDSFTRYGTETDAFAASDMDATVSFWSQRVAAIIKKQYKTQDQSRSPERQVDLAPVMARHHDTPQFNSSQAK